VPDESAALSALYQELILDHYRRPRNRGTLEHPDASVTVANPLCGDEISLTLALDGERVTDARFAGRGCSISQAAASLMIEAVKGKAAPEIAALRRRYGEMLAGDRAAAGDEVLGELRALSGVARVPVRQKCALLAWTALERGLAR
jgi:nitrogen fixation NifU-like protein